MNNEPLVLKANKAQEELTCAILNIQTKYKFPAFLMEMVINSCLLDVKKCSIGELVNSLNIEQEKEEKVEEGSEK